MKHPLFEPLTPETTLRLQGLCSVIDQTCNHEDMEDKKVAFAILLFETGKEPDGTAVYLSSAPREDMLYAIQLWLQKQAEKLISAQNAAAAVSELTPLINDKDGKVLLDRRQDDSNAYVGEDRRESEEA